MGLPPLKKTASREKPKFLNVLLALLGQREPLVTTNASSSLSFDGAGGNVRRFGVALVLTAGNHYSIEFVT